MKTYIDTEGNMRVLPSCVEYMQDDDENGEIPVPVPWFVVVVGIALFTALGVVVRLYGGGR